jgi:UDP-N-acetylglucosamine 2-epimerase (non-hydrolysing)
MKRILSVVGARPNFMKVAPIHRAFQQYSPEFQHCIVHTGQHYDAAMSDAFFTDLAMPAPTVFLGIGGGTHAEQTARIMVEFEKTCLQLQPDLVIVVGDVNSTIACALTAVKLGIPTAHVEAGLRSYDRKMPEEINRIATDSICDYWFTTEESGTNTLLEQGCDKDKVFFVGNTMIDSLHYAMPMVHNATILQEIGIQKKEYALVTMHRPSNVDEPEQLSALMNILAELSNQKAIVFPVHPRTKQKLQEYGLMHILTTHPALHLISPQGYINFVALMNNADFVLTDSGGIQEETTVLGIPCITARTSTERPSTVSLGTNILIDPSPESIHKALHQMMNEPRKIGHIPPLWDGKAAERIASIIVSHSLYKQ